MPDKVDPLVGFHFVLDLGKKAVGYFTECSGIGSEHDVIDRKMVDEKGKDFVQKIPGRLKWGDIVLKRGITNSMDIWNWRKQVEDGKVKDARVNGSIQMLDQELQVVAQWDFERAWPSKVSGPQPKSDSNEIGIEELTIVHEHITRVK